MLDEPRPASLRYGAAILSVVLALLMQLLLDPLIDTDTPFLVLFAAVTISAWFGGTGSGVLATALSALASDYFFISPFKFFWGQSLRQNLPLALFVLEGVLITALSASLHAARQRTEASKIKAQRHQKDLRQSEERYRLLVEGIRDYAIYMLDPQGQVVSWNAGAERIHGYRAEEVLSRHFAMFYPGEEQEENLPDYELRLASQSERFEKTGLQLRKDGTRFWAEIIITTLKEPDCEYGSNSNLRGFAKITRDITERKQTEEALQTRATELTRTTQKLARTATNLEKRNHELDQFAYVLSHDLKAPLRAIANLSQWIEEDLTAEGASQMNADTQHHMKLLRGRVHRMEALIDAALQYSRVGRVETGVTTVAVEALLQEVIATLEPPPGFVIEIGPEMPTLKAERLRLQQVLINLIGNALKHFTPYGPEDEESEGTSPSTDKPRSIALAETSPQVPARVQVAVVEQDDFYEFSVADNGPGIAPRYHEKVFGIFQTLEARDKIENAGIGLALAKKIVESKGGTIRLESQIGQGATFRFTWPKRPAKAEV